MEADLKKRWVEALRSGEYRQGRDYLNLNGRMCCLGVLAEVAGLSSHTDGSIVYYEGDHKNLLKVTCDRFGLPHNIVSNLVNMNDNMMLSFGSIADWIQEHV